MRGAGSCRNQDDLERLMEEARLLRERLHRVTFALAMTEDVLADSFTRLADVGGPHADGRRMAAKRYRAAAAEARVFMERLAERDGAEGLDALTDDPGWPDEP